MWTEQGFRDFLDCVVKFSDFQNFQLKPKIMGVFMIFFGCKLWLKNYRGHCVTTRELGILKSALSYAGLDRA